VVSNAPNVYQKDGIIYVRASAFGKCYRQLWAVWDGIQPMAVGDGTQRAFNEGHLHEEAVWKQREAEGYTMYGDQTTVELKVLPNRLHIVGHIDGFIELGDSTEFTHAEYGNGGPRLWECKAMSRSAFDDWIRDRFDYRPGYAWQLAIYMHGTHTERAHYDVKRRDDGVIDAWLINEPPYSMPEIRARALKLYSHLMSGEMPPCDKQEWFCDYRFLHDEQAVDEPELAVPADNIPELDDLLAMYEEAKATEKWAKDEQDRIKKKIEAEFRNGRDEFGSDMFTVNIQTRTRRNFDKARMVAEEKNGQELLDKYTTPKPYEAWTIKERKNG
jgi:hypothetical protein